MEGLAGQAMGSGSHGSKMTMPSAMSAYVVMKLWFMMFDSLVRGKVLLWRLISMICACGIFGTGG